MSGHPWKLVAPWYRWHALPGDRRHTPPVIQKYETSKFVEEVLADPQHFLAYGAEDWVYRSVRFRPKRVPSPDGQGTLSRSLSNRKVVRTDMRKLFLDTHKRFYLVVCELHCDVAGFPNATRDDVCEAGFVVRRRVTDFPRGPLRQATKILDRIAERQALLRELDRVSGGVHVAVFTRHDVQHDDETRTAVASALAEDHLELAVLAQGAGVATRLEAWTPLAGRDKVGHWTALTEEEPHVVTEQVYPLYPLIPDPRAQHHAATGHAIWFGVVPTGSADIDLDGNPRFDDLRPYELRCFVRRHDPRCPRQLGRRDCKGELAWSAPTSPYQLASQFDLAGTSHHPVTVQLPDIPKLRAEAAALGPGEGAGVRMAAPAGSTLNAKPGFPPTQPSLSSSFQICSFSIPLITIIATFVLNLFLPIVVFLFGLWELLLLRFCIPPKISMNAGLAAQLDVLQGVDLDLGVSASVAAQLQTDLAATLNSVTGPSGEQLGATLTGKYSNSVVAGMARRLTARELPAGAAGGEVRFEPEVRVP